MRSPSAAAVPLLGKRRRISIIRAAAAVASKPSVTTNAASQEGNNWGFAADWYIACTLGPGMAVDWGSLVTVTGLVAVHLWGARLVRVARAPRDAWLSAAGGVSVAFVFLHLLPQLSAGQRLVNRGVTWLQFLDHHVYLAALVGLCAFYGLEWLALRSRREQLRNRSSPAIFWTHVGAFAAYNLLIGYLLVHRRERAATEVAAFFLALAMHLLVIDRSMHEHHKEQYLHRGRYVLAGGVVLGWLIGAMIAVPPLIVSLCFAFLAGAIVLNALKDELPAEREARFWPFALGAAGYAGLLLAI